MPCTMDSAVSPAIALLQQLEIALRDPLLGPHVARQVATALKQVLYPAADAAPYALDQQAYRRLWMCMEDDSVNWQALISLASI